MGKKYDIVVDFYENWGDATCQLSWSTPTVIQKEIIPRSQLYSGQITTQTPTVSSSPTVTPSTSTLEPTAEPTSSPINPPSENYEIDYTIVNDWGSGATVTVEITNTGSSTINGWSLSWTFPGNQEITNLWSGSYTQSGQSITISNDTWNGNISPGSSVNFGFNMVYTGENSTPTNFELN